MVFFALWILGQPAQVKECLWYRKGWRRFRCLDAPQDRQRHTQCDVQSCLDPCRMSGDACTGGGGGEDAWGSVKDDFRVDDSLGDLFDPCSDGSFCPAGCASCSR